MNVNVNDYIVNVNVNDYNIKIVSVNDYNVNVYFYIIMHKYKSINLCNIKY